MQEQKTENQQQKKIKNRFRDKRTEIMAQPNNEWNIYTFFGMFCLQ